MSGDHDALEEAVMGIAASLNFDSQLSKVLMRLCRGVKPNLRETIDILVSQVRLSTPIDFRFYFTFLQWPRQMKLETTSEAWDHNTIVEIVLYSVQCLVSPSPESFSNFLRVRRGIDMSAIRTPEHYVCCHRGTVHSIACHEYLRETRLWCGGHTTHSEDS